MTDCTLLKSIEECISFDGFRYESVIIQLFGNPQLSTLIQSSLVSDSKFFPDDHNSSTMAQQDQIRTRRSINAIYQDYLNGKQQELTDLIRAWKGICDISQQDPNAWNSFFKIGGMHGEPFRGAGYSNLAWWGGWCHHGNVLFPTWHRAYCFHIENALRSIPGCSNVTLPYWDETGEDTKVNGVPGIFLEPQFILDGEIIDNPLHCYTFPQNIVDRADQDPTSKTYNMYTKRKGYKTVRYPYSGLVGTDEAKVQTEEHNSKFTPEEAAEHLNANVQDWLNAGVWINGVFNPTGTRAKFEKCLHAPNYTVFSNTTSAQAWNDDATPVDQVVALESPHNDIHLAVGGFQVPGTDKSPISGANGDMGENDTAGLDPIFFFHHCEIDRYFWLWQQKHNSTKTLDIIPEYPGTNSVDNQGPTPGVAGGTWLTLDTELQPFWKTEPSTSGPGTYMTSRDVVDTTALGYTYDTPIHKFLGALPPPQRAATSVRISGVHKNNIAGSHQLMVYATLPGEKQRKLIAVDSVLSRWHVSGCANCQLTTDVQRYAPLHGLSAEDVESGAVELTVEVVTRSGINRGGKLGNEHLKPTLHVVGKGKKYLG